MTIPKELREALNLSPGDKVNITERDGALVLEPVRLTVYDLIGTVARPAHALTVAEMRAHAQAYVAEHVRGDSAD